MMIQVDGKNFPFYGNALYKIEDFETQHLKNPCHVHPNVLSDFICLDLDQKYIFKCIQCVKENLISKSSLISIDKILENNQKTVYQNSYFKDSELSKQLNFIVNESQTNTLLEQYISRLFANIEIKISEEINKIKKNIIKDIQKQDISQKLMIIYNKIISKEDLKNIITDTNKPMEIKSQLLKKHLFKVKNELEQKEEYFMKKILFLNKIIIEDYFDEKNLRDILQKMFQKFEEIQVSIEENVKNLFDNIQPKKKSKKSSSMFDFKNNCIQTNNTDQLSQFPIHFLDQFSQTPQQCSSPKESVTLSIDNSNIDGVPKGNKIKSKSFFLLDFENVSSIQCEQDFPLEDMKNSQNLRCIDKPQKKIRKIEQNYGEIKEQKPPKEKKTISLFNQNQRGQCKRLNDLDNIIEYLIQNYGNCYQTSDEPLKKIQPNSWQLMKLIRKVLISKISSSKDKNRIDQSLSQLFVKYPIFELLPPLQFHIPIPKVFTPTSFLDSSQMIIKQTEKGAEISFPKSSQKYGQVVTAQLNNKIGYLLRLKFNRPYGKHKDSGSFRIGIIPRSEIDSKCVNPQNNPGFYSAPDLGHYDLIKGNFLDSEQISRKTSEIEFRWCIEQRQMFISNLEYSNVNQAIQIDFDPKEIYCFGICFYDITENDQKPWTITVTDFCEIDPEEVSPI